MAGFLQRFYAKVYINVIVESHYVDICIRIEKMGMTKDRINQRFDVFGGVIPNEAIRFMEKYERRSPFSYISVLNPIHNQGAKFGCSAEGMQKNICTG